MESLTHWLEMNASVLAAVVTIGVAIFLFCCVECLDCSKRKKDELFHRHDV